jgi:hypothetical protein
VGERGVGGRIAHATEHRADLHQLDNLGGGDSGTRPLTPRNRKPPPRYSATSPPTRPKRTTWPLPIRQSWPGASRSHTALRRDHTEQPPGGAIRQWKRQVNSFGVRVTRSPTSSTVPRES